MLIIFDKAFLKSLDKVNNNIVKHRLEKIILEIEQANTINDIKNVKKLTGFQKYYRIRLGDYRIGFELIEENTIKFIVIAHRKDIYRIYP